MSKVQEFLMCDKCGLSLSNCDCEEPCSECNEDIRHCNCDHSGKEVDEDTYDF